MTPPAVIRSAGHILDNPAWAALVGPHARFAERRGQAARYQPDVAPIVALPDHHDPSAWDDVAALVGPGATIPVFRGETPPPSDWGVVMEATGLQLVDTASDTAPGRAATVLGPLDVPEMLDLVARAQPGPFLPRTIELGTYLGIRHHGSLVAMAGERLHPPGWSEISAVCTDEAHRGQGLATQLIKAIAAGTRARGETPFLHVAANNTNALRLYLALGFTLRREVHFVVVRTPASNDDASTPRLHNRSFAPLEEHHYDHIRRTTPPSDR